MKVVQGENSRLIELDTELWQALLFARNLKEQPTSYISTLFDLPVCLPAQLRQLFGKTAGRS